jgi:hypothetical protein
VKSVSSALLGVAAVALLAFAPSAAAATEFGSTCESDSARLGNPAGVQLSRATGAVRTSAAGVVTMWKVRTDASTSGSEKLKVYKQVGGAWETIAESTGSSIYESGKLNEFPVRIPVPAGVNFGVASAEEKLPYCTGSAGDTIGFFAVAAEVGAATPVISMETEATLALAVVVEPDVDGDEYGDETQDSCPQSAALHTPCPLAVTPPTVAPPAQVAAPAPGTFSIGLKPKLEGNVVAVQVTGGTLATVTLHDVFRGRPVAGPTSVGVSPGATARVFLPLSKSLKTQLAALPRKRHLNVVIEASGRTAAGATGAASAELALPGRKKPAKHHHRDQ